MRFGVEILLENEMIPKDKNRIILSLLKSCFSSYNEDYYKALYMEEQNKKKDFTFSLYLGNCKFLREEILVPSKKILLNFSSYHHEDGIMFFNSILHNKGKSYPITNNTITLQKINLIREKLVHSYEVTYRPLSPIVVREHSGNNKKTWYHSLSNQEGQAIFIENLKYQIKDALGEKGLLDFEDVKIEIAQTNKEVKVKNYGIEVLSNITNIKMKGQPYILDYLYKAGIGSKRSSGFGMVDIV
ncbi:CRISPR-associated endoribonuclease Cas6 [Clostridium formicaceticum]|uniref:CRISPR associated protein Cas6 n=1 Tax=Clostridium formicaceticum TaxID=1497 RepID=A0AAC9WGK3_9CLOT|nr:CRISPR-associated endoribonuclease Cas6 [Clostridium formicaceticum]AOY77484.1 CRISPR-associated endoribonuclease Cas6 [Clostridium formicaceticum]ARE88047.1 CRISPR associated protein Cas6 [Clostridium formicaceticum]